MWRFVQISDPHLGSQVDGLWNNRFLCTMMPDVMRCLRRDLAALKPDFILATGDLSSRHTRDAMFAARDFMDWLGFPYYPMGGNHDFVIEASRPWFREAFHAHLPSERMFYSFDREDLHVVVLDPLWAWSNGLEMEYSEQGSPDVGAQADQRPVWVVPDAQLEWLDRDLQAHAGTATIVACHYPAIEIPERMRRPGMRDAGSLSNGKELIAALRRHPQVRAIFSGHLHMNIIVEDGGLTHVVTSALPEYPSEYREVQVYEDRLEIRSRALSDPSFAARSLVPNNGWTAGQACDRRATVSLT